MNLSPNFTLEELTATRQIGPDGRVLDNHPRGSALDSLQRLCVVVLEPIRSLLDNRPLIVTSGYRSEAVERAVQRRGADELLDPSQHLRGEAADIVPCASIGMEAAFHRIYCSAIPWDQLLLEGPAHRRWIHVSCAPVTRLPRRQALVSSDGRTWSIYDGTTVRLS